MDMRDSHIVLRFAEALPEDSGGILSQDLGRSHGFLRRFRLFLSLCPSLSDSEDLLYLLYLKTVYYETAVNNYCGIAEACPTA